MALAATQLDRLSEVTEARVDRSYSGTLPQALSLRYSAVFEYDIIDEIDEWLPQSNEESDSDTTMLPRLLLDDNVGPTDLRDALRDLHESRVEALQEGFDAPTDSVIQNAELLIERMFEILPRRYEVYPIDGGEIAIQVPGEYGWSMVVFCETQGTILCMMAKNGEHLRYRSEIVDIESGGFIWRGLSDLAAVWSLRFGTRAA